MKRALLWIGVYLALVAAPLLVLLRDPPPGLGFSWDLAMALGYAGMAMMGVQFLLTARFRRATAPFGVDIIYYFHRYLAVLAVGLIVGHYLLLLITSPEALAPRSPFAAPWHMSAGRVSLLLFVFLIVSSLWRKPLGLEYDRWRLLHSLFAVIAFVLGLAHIWGAGYYLKAPLKGFAWSAAALAWLLLVLYIRVARPLALRRRPFRVVDVSPERGEVWTVTVEPDGHEGFGFEPGQFAWMTLRASPFALREHPFSFSSSPEEAPRLRFTIKELGDFTRTIKDVQPGEVAYVDGPYGVFSVDRYPQAPGFVFIAGGIGVAPMMSMLRSLAARGETRPILLLYGNERWDRVVFREELGQLEAKLSLEVVHVLGDPPEGWTGEQGVLSEELLRRRLPKDVRERELFLCGPNPMLRAVEESLYELKVPLARVHSEIFDMA